MDPPWTAGPKFIRPCPECAATARVRERGRHPELAYSEGWAVVGPAGVGGGVGLSLPIGP
jgi:hypothetical protein